jgi:aryl-alcohol dehydrogenase-like predicted oxidoreductase
MVFILTHCQDISNKHFSNTNTGYFRSPSSEPKTEGRNTPFLINGREVQVSQALENVSKRHNVGINSVALAYVLQKVSSLPVHKFYFFIASLIRILPKAPHIYPILGGRKIEHLKANVEALSLELSPQDVAEIEDAYPYDPGFPHNFISRTGKAPRGPQDINTVNRLGHFDYVQGPTAIRPHKEEPKA